MHKWSNVYLATKQRKAEGITGPSTDPDRVFFDVTIGGLTAGRIVMRLHSDVAPKTCENFRLLCTGERGRTRGGVRLSYEGTVFHRLVKGFVVQGGDVTGADGAGGACALPYDPSGTAREGQFDDENFRLSHDRPGRLSMANKGPHTNNSQFFFTLAPAPHLDGKNVCFGDVEAGMEVVQAIARLDTHGDETTSVAAGATAHDVEGVVDVHRPRLEVKINACGEMPIENTAEDAERRKQAEIAKQQEDIEKSVAGVRDAVAAAVSKRKRGDARKGPTSASDDESSDGGATPPAKRKAAANKKPQGKKKGGLLALSSDEESDA